MQEFYVALKAIFKKEIGKGLGLVLSLNIVNYIVSAFTFLSSLGSCGPYGVRGDIGSIMLFYWGVTQFLYTGPMIFFGWRKGKRDFVQGLVFGACLTVIANVGTYFFNDPILSGLAKMMDTFQYCFGLRN